MREPIRPLLQPQLTDLPRGPHGLARELVTGSQRQRLLYAMIVAVADKGYTAATVADATRRAGVSRKTFYELFTDKDPAAVDPLAVRSRPPSRSGAMGRRL
ncbi:TetR/AcrR family transcriptional regulator, partial [Streptomyces sp. NPDC003832]